MIVAVAAVFVLPLVSCVRPTSFEKFVRADQAEDGLYSFELDLSDSLATYDISFFTASDEQSLDYGSVLAVWEGPSGQKFTETVYPVLPGGLEKYRTGVSMVTPGLWKLSLRLKYCPEDFRGIGIICERNGTR